MQKSPKLIMKGLPGAVRAGGDFQFQLHFAESLKSRPPVTSLAGISCGVQTEPRMKGGMCGWERHSAAIW